MKQQVLFPELGIAQLPEKPTNVASVPQRSPFRYPGGKTWLVPKFRRWMKNLGAPVPFLIEPFAGGGTISLTAAFENLAAKIIMVELDEQVAAVWKVIFDGDAEWLANRIVNFKLDYDSVKTTLEKKTNSLREEAFQTLLKNRTAHGGILARGAGIIKNGENGKGLHSRWYPETIARRIRTIESVASKVTFIHGDGFDMIEKFRKRTDAVFFIDPPYTAGGKRAGSRLYQHFEMDHERLFALCKEIRGDFLMTYDNANEVQQLAEKHGFETRLVPMKNTHHAKLDELLVGKDLAWLE
jgi:DNA adenine methylase